MIVQINCVIYTNNIEYHNKLIFCNNYILNIIIKKYRNMSSTDKAFEICKEMIQQRYYKCLDVDDKHYKITALKPDGTKMYIIFHTIDILDTKNVKDIIQLLNDQGIKHVIIVYKNNVTAASKNIIRIINTYKIELFAEEDLQYNITKHRLQPIFSKLSEDDTDAFKQLYKTSIPILCHDKPIARFYNYNKGDIIQVTRQNNSIEYRIVK